MVKTDPAQRLISGAASFDKSGYSITPLADFHLHARVLSRKNYRSGREADLSPVDLALGWGRMSDEQVIQQIDISQSNRWYRWQVEDAFPIPRREIETHSGNMHLIPADAAIARELDRIRKGELIELRGNLVRVEAEDGWRWVSSLKRTDTGARSCELIWVESISMMPPTLTTP